VNYSSQIRVKRLVGRDYFISSYFFFILCNQNFAVYVEQVLGVLTFIFILEYQSRTTICIDYCRIRKRYLFGEILKSVICI
jgi:hypothetical protein